jgi:antitoxin (DNA-binding transcriptional repressor) of toxin-antitoxin stability system
MKIVDTQGSTTTLAQLVDQLEHGEELMLARGGKLVARVTAIPNGERRMLGQWRGRVRMSDDFDAPLPDAELAAWHGDPA